MESQDAAAFLRVMVAQSTFDSVLKDIRCEALGFGEGACCFVLRGEGLLAACCVDSRGGGARATHCLLNPGTCSAQRGVSPACCP